MLTTLTTRERLAKAEADDSAFASKRPTMPVGGRPLPDLATKRQVNVLKAFKRAITGRRPSLATQEAWAKLPRSTVEGMIDQCQMQVEAARGAGDPVLRSVISKRKATPKQRKYLVFLFRRANGRGPNRSELSAMYQLVGDEITVEIRRLKVKGEERAHLLNVNLTSLSGRP